MKVWLPGVRSNSGSDVFVERLAALLAEAGCDPIITWFPLRYELCPWLLRTAPIPEGTEIIHANSWNAFAFSGRGCPLIVTVHHCVRGLGYPAWKGPFQALYHDHWIGRFEAISFRRAEAVLCGSASAAAEVEESFDLDKKIKVVDYWLDASVFRPSYTPAVTRPRVLWVGNMSLRKGGDLLPAFRQCLDSGIELHVVAGRRGQTAGLEALGPNVKVWSRLHESDLIKLYQDCDITVCLSRHEGFGYTALEAMACGRPVVAFNVTGLKDVIVDGRTGILRPCGDLAGVAAACKRLIERPEQARTMGQAGRERAEYHFSAARASALYTQIYRDAASAFRLRQN
ncbi:MAG: glycosyltransferase family 4 protein [Variovorax paradoxus]|nr:glycosyltransferase family 4 protein [Variovorax paradoxus]MBW8715886.1 glycosyltransferase family 4 protein [Variovorax paradoxus]